MLETTDAFEKISDGRSWEKLSFQEQQQVRLLGILEQTSKKYGEQVGDNLSLKLSQTSASFNNVKTEASKFLAVGLQPLLTSINNVCNNILIFVKWLNTLDDSSKKLITNFGIAIAVIPVVALVFLTLIKAINSYVIWTSTASATTVMLTKNMFKLLGAVVLLVAGIAMIAYSLGAFNNFGKSAKKTTAGIDTANKAIENLSASQNANADSAEKANKANKKLADNLQSFDEINKLSLDNDSSNLDNNIGPTIDLSGIDTSAFDNIGIQVDNLKNKVQNVKNKFEEFKEYIGVIGGILLGGSLMIFFGKIGFAIGLIISGIMSFKNTLNSIKDFKGGESINKTLGNILLTIGLIMGAVFLLFGAIPALIAGLITAIVLLIIFLKENWDEFCLGLKVIWEKVWTAIKNFFIGIADWFSKKWTAFKVGWKYVCDSIGIFFKDTWQGIKDFFIGIWTWICNKADNIKVTFTNVWENIKKSGKNIWNNFLNWWSNSIPNWFNNKVKPWFTWEKWKGLAQNAVNGIKNAFANMNLSFKLPHFSWSTQPAPQWIGNILSALNLPNSIPKLNVSWYKNGGVFGGTSIIGVGEYPGAKSNPEIVAPKSMIYDTIIQANTDSNKSSVNLSSGSDSIKKKIEVEVDLKSGGVKLGKQILDLVLDANDFYDLGLI